MRKAKIPKLRIDRSRRALPTYRQVPACRRTLFGIVSRARGAKLCKAGCLLVVPSPGRSARELPLVCDHVQHLRSSGRSVESLTPRRRLHSRAGKRCGIARRGRSARRRLRRRRPRQWLLRRRPRRRIRGRPRRRELSPRRRVRWSWFRWKAIPARARPRWPPIPRGPVLLRPLLRLRIRLPVQRVLRPVFTLLRSSILLMRSSLGLRPTTRPNGKPSHRHDARSERQRARLQDAQIGALSVSLRERESSNHLAVVGVRRGGRAPPPRGRRLSDRDHRYVNAITNHAARGEIASRSVASSAGSALRWLALPLDGASCHAPAYRHVPTCWRALRPSTELRGQRATRGMPAIVAQDLPL
jgi:hypothetical protein